MSPEPCPVKLNENQSSRGKSEKSSTPAAVVTPQESGLSNDNIDPKQESINKGADGQDNEVLLKPPMDKRERKNASPHLNGVDAFPDPMSPSSSSSTSQATSANDTTFEPTVEMMVNDFDDEQTLNEEEALAAMESQDPEEEINTLKEESEMPIEELLAKYSSLAPIPFAEVPRKRPKKSHSNSKKHKSKVKSAININEDINFECGAVDGHKSESKLENTINDTYQAEENGNEKCEAEELDDELLNIEESNVVLGNNNSTEFAGKRPQGSDKLKVRHTHLLDLYPEGTFSNKTAAAEVNAGIRLETMYGIEDEEFEIEEEDDEEYKKKVMVGPAYQANIPYGLSLYGDILPYENEDKLIWEPSQVSEREVEEYLVKIRDIKSNPAAEEEVTEVIDSGVISSKTNGHIGTEEETENIPFMANSECINNSAGNGILNSGELEGLAAVVKDNEQALHLLVQCGYDFKEALRRKRLNALPLNDCMSLWSEEECQKFEEGIQKYGKDFFKIRQNQVRTRTMRELVQFYYLWKKSERRDQNFANADTVDHMDIYLNEDNEYGSNSTSVITPVGSPVGHAASTGASRRSSSNSQKNISIMVTAGSNTTNPSCTAASMDKTNTATHVQQKRQASNGLTVTTDANIPECSLPSPPASQANASAISPK